MSSYRTLMEYKEDKKTFGRQRFLSVYTSPVLLTANPALAEGTPSSGFLTRPETTPSLRAGLSLKKQSFVVSEDFLVIPIVKADGRPFPERIGIGRTRGTDITLADRDISKYHGYFTIVKDQWFYTDANSSNGSFLEGERLQPMVAMPLEDGTLLGFGARRHLFRTAVGFCDFLETV